MNNPVDNVEIKEPPIQKLNNNRSCLKRSCMTGCLILLILVISFFVIIKFAATPRVKKLKELPEIVPENIPIYDKENIESISYIAARERTRTIEAAAILPKAVLIPIFVGTEQYLPEEVQAIIGSTEGEGLDRYVELLQKPLFPTADLIEIRWTHMPAEPDFVKEYYEKELQKNGFAVVIIVNEKEVEEIRFTNEDNSITGRFFTHDKTPEERGTDEAFLNIEIDTN